MEVCVSDIGSASVRMLIARRSGRSGDLGISFNRGIVTRLFEGVAPDGTLSGESRRRTLNGLMALLGEIGRRPERGVCLATQAVRAAPNGIEFARTAGKICGYPVEILSAGREAELAMKGSIELLERDGLLIDLGGGSTEWMVFNPQVQTSAMSFPYGAGTLLKEIDVSGTLSAGELARLNRTARDLVAPSVISFQNGFSGTPVVLGGTAASAAVLILGVESYRSGCVHGHYLPASALISLQHELSRMDCREREKLTVEPGRGTLIVGGLAILNAICSGLDIDGIRVSEYGIRYGYAREILIGEPF